MSYEDRNGLPRSFENGFPLCSKDDFPHSDQCENVFSSSRIGGTGHHASSTLPPPLHVTFPMLRFRQVERCETNQALLACRHQDGNFLCVHVLQMKSYIDKLDRLGVVFPREQAIELVLLSLPKSYD